MKGITTGLMNLQPYITIVLIITTIILLISLVIITKSLNRLEKRYKKLTRGINNKNLEEIVIQYLDNIDSVKADTEIVKNQQLELQKRLNTCVQKVAIVRYKAFEDIGSDLSFLLHY
jgi:ABC-type multidrug transport system fused ATPase/permease subunit